MHDSFSRIGWNPTRGGLLACITKETNNISLHDVQTSVVTDEPDLVVLTRNIKCSKESPSAFAWHPKDENRWGPDLSRFNVKRSCFSHLYDVYREVQRKELISNRVSMGWNESCPQWLGRYLRSGRWWRHCASFKNTFNQFLRKEEPRAELGRK